MTGKVFKLSRRWAMCGITLSVALFLNLFPLHAQPAQKKIVAGISTLTGSSAILAIAQKAGLFEKHDIQGQVVYFSNGTIAASALLSGDVKISLMSANATLAAAIAGSEVIQIGGLTNKLDYGLMVLPSVKSLYELKGQSLGIAGFGGASDFAANYIIRKEGMIPGKDIILMPVGGQQERLTALATSKLKAVLLQPPFTKRAEKMGFRRLVDFASLDLEFQTLGYATTRSYLRSDREACLNFLKAATEATFFLKSRKNESKAILAAFLKTDDAEALEETYSLNARYLIPELPYSSLKGLQNTLELMAYRNPKAKTQDPREVIDDSLIRKMEESGFVAYLRNTYPVSAQ